MNTARPTNPVNPSYGRIVHDTKVAVEKNFEVITRRNGNPARAKDFKKIKHLDWVPPQMLDWAWACNAWELSWQLRTEDPDWRGTLGRVRILPISGPAGWSIYNDWEGIIYFADEPLTDPLRPFKIVDWCADEYCVGIYHDARCQPELYYYSGDHDPKPLGVDLNGYLQLLPHTLGFRAWQGLVHELAAPDSPRPYRPQPNDCGTTGTVAGMEKHLSGFDLDAFTALFDQVRLTQPAP